MNRTVRDMIANEVRELCVEMVQSLNLVLVKTTLRLEPAERISRMEARHDELGTARLGGRQHSTGSHQALLLGHPSLSQPGAKHRACLTTEVSSWIRSPHALIKQSQCLCYFPCFQLHNGVSCPRHTIPREFQPVASEVVVLDSVPACLFHRHVPSYRVDTWEGYRALGYISRKNIKLL